MQFTGERYVPTEQGQIRLEHYHRYATVLNLVSGKKVLDVACGEGYGSALMASTAMSVTGVDIADEAIQHALATYADKKNLTYVQGSATALQFPDAVFDVVVSFETIEHLSAQTEMLAELRRVLHPEGILVISSPNRPVYSKENPYNEFHIKELDFNEFDALLKSQYAAVRYYGQRLLMGSVIQTLNGGEKVYEAWHDSDSDIKQEVGQLSEPVYFLAVCSTAEANLPELAASIACPEQLDLVKNYIGFAKWAQLLDSLIAERDAQVVNLNHALEERDQTLADRNQELADCNVKITVLSRQLAKLESSLRESDERFNSIIRSTSWKITLPLREIKRWILVPRQQLKRYFKYFFHILKKIYEWIPLSAPARIVLSKFKKELLKKLSHNASPSNEIMEISLAKSTETILKTYVEFLKNPNAKIILPISENPVVSIIIPVYGKTEYTLLCLASIERHPPRVSFEVIIIDDLSPDNSAEILARNVGVRLIHNEVNQGFLRSCNIGAVSAKGKYLCFLNNDTEVTPGWLDELVRTFDLFPGTGLAGSKLIYPDGRLQEAGGIIWQDGSAWNFGRFNNPDLPVYNYAREVDYCSGASIIIPKALFIELGGFDERYVPAYCEDSDLALKIREKGYRVIYQPMSCVLHYEGISSGTDISLGVKAYQVTNLKKQYQHWKNKLLKHQPAGKDVEQAKDRRALYRVLFLDHSTPTPDQDSGSIDAFNQMLLLREMDFQVTFVPAGNFQYSSLYTTILQRNGIEVLYAPYVTSLESHLREYGHRYHLVFMCRPTIAVPYITLARNLCSNAKILFHTVDLHFLRMQREAQNSGDKAAIEVADKMRHQEVELINTADISTVVSEYELKLLEEHVPVKKVRLLPYSRHIEGTNTTFADRKDIVFIGGYQHPPNVDAARYLIEDIMPLLRKGIPGIRLYIAGSKPPKEIQKLAGEDVIITGFVKDLSLFLDKMRVSVAPLRYGAGIKGKIGTSMAAGLPVVATPMAVEGMSLHKNENILVAEDPHSFAEAVVKVYMDEALWNQLSQAGLRFAEQAWGAETGRKILSSIISDFGIKVGCNKYPLSLYSEVMDYEDWTLLKPIAKIKSPKEFESAQDSYSIKLLENIERQLLTDVHSKNFSVPGFCIPCDKKSSFLVDMKAGGRRSNNTWLPNWRERMECPSCNMNNRQRLVAALVKQFLSRRGNQHVYFMEQVTPIYKWAVSTFRENSIVGSEFLGSEYISGTIIGNLRHENIENLSFCDAQFDLIVSNDVFEHVPSPLTAFKECARILRPGGEMLVTIPFHSNKNASVVRAKFNEDKLINLQPPAYHGNPVSDKGSLVFTDFGWDVLDQVKAAGFSDVWIELYASTEYGHLGGAQVIFRALMSNDFN